MKTYINHVDVEVRLGTQIRFLMDSIELDVHDLENHFG